MMKRIKTFLATSCLVSTPLFAQSPARPDAQFMRDMIMHHSQAIEMSAMVPERTNREDIRALAERITISQQQEIEVMRGWLKAMKQDTSDININTHVHMHMHMPGMLSPEQMDTLEDSKGVDFEKNYLRFMIQHHEGALTMVENLIKALGGIRDPVLWQMATNIDADQRAEIARMKNLLSNLH